LPDRKRFRMLRPNNRERQAVRQNNKLGQRVWCLRDGKRREGVLRWEDETHVLIKVDGLPGLAMLSKASEGERWGFVDST
jgi:hypothetical protein